MLQIVGMLCIFKIIYKSGACTFTRRVSYSIFQIISQDELTNEPTSPVEQSLFGEANSSLATQEIFYILWNPMV
jgi:hypothetical protein